MSREEREQGSYDNGERPTTDEQLGFGLTSQGLPPDPNVIAGVVSAREQMAFYDQALSGDMPRGSFFRPVAGEVVESSLGRRVRGIAEWAGALAIGAIKSTGPGQFVMLAQQQERELYTGAVEAGRAAREKFKADLVSRREQSSRVGRVMVKLVGPAVAAMVGESARDRYLRENRFPYQNRGN